MPYIHLLFSGFILLLFLGAVFVLSWYIALPLLLVWAVWGTCRWCYLKIQQYRYRRAANGCTIRHKPATKPQATVIDVDYTEIS